MADQDAPLENVYAEFFEGDRTQDPILLLPELLTLFEMGLVVFRQQPIQALGQSFPSRPINPKIPADILGDLGEAFEEFRVKREMFRLDIGNGPSGVPFGIWVDMTPAGRVEWERPEYADYCEGLFEDGARVEVQGHGGWPDGTIGTITPFPSFVREMCTDPPHGPYDFVADGLGRRSKGRVGDVLTQYVAFDEPTDDGSGDGPYGGSEILVQYLHRINE